ncbi:exodeoxyribonuclease VII large subunit, partial [Candidatus Aerophobetes bacterium]|nr:exodeoxyribonuclease VII large subunit [Candidatus Aerophobetes bacterium]
MGQNLHIHTVTEITAYIKGTLEEDVRLQDILIRGEISNYRFPGKHLYFSLKDSGAILSCIMFEEKLQQLKFDIKNGLEVIARGNIGVYPPQGKYQLYVEELFPLGRGLLYLAFERLKKELMEKGYFDPAHKTPLPFLPQRIGIVTSLKGAAIRDILRVLDDRFPNLDIVISPCKVQGEEAAQEIAQAINNLNEYGEVDVIIVGRGGGSIEDLFAFNEKVVAEAIYNSRIPVISAVGHEIDL